MVNKQNIQKIIDYLRKDEQREVKHFVMGDWGHFIDGRESDHAAGYADCNTACCIAGWANTLRMMEEKDPDLNDANYWVQVVNQYAAGEWLGLGGVRVRLQLFTLRDDPASDDWLVDSDKFDAHPNRYKAAIWVLEKLRDEGVVDWRGGLAHAGMSRLIRN